jgi:hypothetical protein
MRRAPTRIRNWADPIASVARSGITPDALTIDVVAAEGRPTKCKEPTIVATPPSHVDMPAMPMPQRETPAIHGMFMFGSDTVFLSHKPMFAMANHQYQVVLRVMLPPDAMNPYRTPRRLSFLAGAFEHYQIDGLGDGGRDRRAQNGGERGDLADLGPDQDELWHRAVGVRRRECREEVFDA